MSFDAVSDVVRAWLDRRFSGNAYKVVRTIAGTYGVVWILETERTNVSSDRFAVKSFDPTKLLNKIDADVRTLFERELALWLRVPFHRNVLGALGLEFVPLDSATQSVLPLMRMSFMDGTLADWIDRPEPGVEQRLAAIAQCCNGLAWLYENGLEGHGDLKPSNVLFRDLHQLYSPTPGLPRWKIVVGDLGWADIWRDIEGKEAARRGWRPYLGPERLAGSVVPVASDMFAIGVIAAEVLGGTHPAGAPTASVAKWKEDKYARWAANEPRRFSSGLPRDVTSLFGACLAPRPEDRPTPNEVIDQLCRRVGDAAGYDLRTTLELWTLEARGSNIAAHEPWAAEVAGDLGGLQLDRSIERLEATVSKEPETTDPNLARWLMSSLSYARLLSRRDQAADRRRAGDAALRVLRCAVENFETIDVRRELYSDPLTGDLAISDLTREEVTAGFAYQALGLLNRLGRDDDPPVHALRTALSVKERAHHPSVEQFVRMLESLPPDDDDRGN